MKNDYQTSTVDGAAEFARMYAEKPDDDFDGIYEEESEESDGFDDECNCSDPGCPCGGNKNWSRL